jgi:branched-chain amino acid aminotransferase
MATTTLPGAGPIPVRRTSTPKPKPPDDELGFGNVFTDHLFVQEYDADRGWHDARIEPYRPLTLDPAALVLHYAQEVFDGMKAFRDRSGRVRLFRPDRHAARLGSSAERLCIPPLDPDEVQRGIAALVDVDRDWVPSAIGTALYIRPNVIATEAYLGVRPSRSFLYYIILAPVGGLYGSVRPVRILVEDQFVRAVEGGVGAAKTAGNYAASLYAAEQAKQAGYDQVLWLDGVQRQYIDEVGTMNIMFRFGDEVVTPPLSGTILPGITRDSIITLLRDWGVPVSERPVSIDEVLAAVADGSLREVWGTGTAAVVSPVGELGYRGHPIVINGGRTGELTQRLYDGLTAIQFGTAPDNHGWMVEVG